MRATDQARPPADRIVDDPYAARFLGALTRAQLGGGPLAGVLVPTLATYVLCRHRYMDDRLLEALAGGPDRAPAEQVVVLGAGYDMRAYRFTTQLAGRPVFEVDYPSTAARKLRLLRGQTLPEVDVRRVAIDFQTQTLDEVLGLAGFRAGAPTFFTWEGVSMYLTRAAVKNTLTTLLRIAGPGSALTMDFWQYLDAPDLAGTAHRVSAGLLHVLGEPVTFALHPEDAPDFLRRLGWTPVDVATADELGRRYVKDGRGVYAANYVVTARAG